MNSSHQHYRPGLCDSAKLHLQGFCNPVIDGPAGNEHHKYKEQAVGRKQDWNQEEDGMNAQITGAL